MGHTKDAVKLTEYQLQTWLENWFDKQDLLVDSTLIKSTVYRRLKSNNLVDMFDINQLASELYEIING